MAQPLTTERLVSALLPAAGGFLRTLGRAARQLLHEVTGALFAVFAGIGAVSAWQAWRQSSPGWVIGISIGFAAMMGYFSTMAFWKAQRIEKGK
ncbi:MAG: hypothetical protein ACRD5W_10665 [Candidatus Acidiferrales bacterium]